MLSFGHTSGFDVINAIECAASIAQAIGAVVAVKLGYSVLALAVSVFAVACS